MKTILAVTLVALCFQSMPTQAASPVMPECKSLAWPLEFPPRDLEEVKIGMDRLTRDQAVQVAWHEILDPNSRLAVPVLAYLAYSEPNGGLQGYFKSMVFILTDEGDVAQAVKKWQSLKRRASPMALERLCELYKVSVSQRRPSNVLIDKPTSVKPKAKPVHKR